MEHINQIRFIAHFSPEAWVNNNAIPVDPEGEQEWDCTTGVLDHVDYFRRMFEHDVDDLADFGAIDGDDVLKSDPAAPEWVREHRGPFTLRVRPVRE